MAWPAFTWGIRGQESVTVAGSDLSSLTLAIADLKAIDARLTTLGAAGLPIESDGVDLTAAIRQSQALVRAAIARLTGARISDEGAIETAEPGAGGAKRRVKIKAASETTESSRPTGAEAAVRSDSSPAKASGKAATRGGDRSRGAAAAASSTAAAPAKTPPSSLLARLGAAAPEPDARPRAAADGGGPAAAPPPKSDTPGPHDTADRLARLEAEIDSLTKSSNTADTQSKAVVSNGSAQPTATKPADVRTPSPAAGTPVPALQHRPRVGDGGAGDDEDDAEIVIVNSQSKAAGSTEHGVASPRPSSRVVNDPPPSDDDDSEVEIVQPGARHEADGTGARVLVPGTRDRTNASATKPAAPAKWRLFRGSR
jgi:hypothetical protein